MEAPKIGTIWTFVPAAFMDNEDDKRIPYRVQGTVINVNAEHRHFTVRTTVWGHTLCESFKF